MHICQSISLTLTACGDATKIVPAHFAEINGWREDAHAAPLALFVDSCRVLEKRGRTLADASLDEMDALWNEAKDKLMQSGSGLSGGQQQRLCIARGIAIKPEVLLLDEPCSALDPISTLAIEDLIAELKQDFTIVIVTHNMQQAARVSDQTAFFNLEATGKPGKLVEVDDTEKIFSNPAQRATEDYISGRFG